MTRSRILCAVAAMLCVAQIAAAQGPLRRAARGAAEVTGDVARGAAEVTSDAARVTAQGIRAATPGVPVEARAGGPVDRNATWRTQRYHNEYWYYTPENSWMVYRNNQWTPYSADATVTTTQQYAGSVPNSGSQTVFIDSGGRAVLCQNGRIVFVDGTALQSVSRSQINAQGYLIQQGAVQGQAAAGQQSVVAGYAPQSTLQQSTAAQVDGQANAQAPAQASGQAALNADAPAQAAGQASVNTNATPPAAPSASASGAANVQGDSSSPSAGASADVDAGADTGDAASDAASSSDAAGDTGASVSGAAEASSK